LDRERSYALIVRVGAPSRIDYRGTRKQPFWRLREAITFRVFEEERLARWRECVVTLKSAAQGYPQDGFNLKATEALELEAMNAARGAGEALLPWLEWPEVESARAKAERELEQEGGGLIEAWIARFEPENLQKYQDRRAQRIAQRAQANAK
jgi:hypothetical protein